MSRGFSLVELVFVLGIVATVSVVALAGIDRSVGHARAVGAARYVAAKLQRTRVDAVTRNRNVALKVSATTGVLTTGMGCCRETYRMAPTPVSGCRRRSVRSFRESCSAPCQTSQRLTRAARRLAPTRFVSARVIWRCFLRSAPRPAARCTCSPGRFSWLCGSLAKPVAPVRCCSNHGLVCGCPWPTDSRAPRRASLR